MAAEQMIRFTCDNPNCRQQVTVHTSAQVQHEMEDVAPWILVVYNNGDKENYCRPTCAAQVLSVKSSLVWTPENERNQSK